jgi:uncharacterized protein (TIGR03067 family)
MRIGSCFILVMLFFVPIHGLSHGQEKDALAPLQGVWMLTKNEVQGRALPEDQIKAANITLTIKDNTYRRRDQGTLKVDPTKTPKHLDLMVEDGNFKGKTLLCIYSVAGDTLTICQGLPSKGERPMDFKTTPDSGTILFIYAKQKR